MLHELPRSHANPGLSLWRSLNAQRPDWPRHAPLEISHLWVRGTASLAHLTSGRSAVIGVASEVITPAFGAVASGEVRLNGGLICHLDDFGAQLADRALDLGGAVVLVMDAGHTDSYQQHRALFDRLLSAGSLIVSPYPPERAVTKPRKRDLLRTLSALSEAIYVLDLPDDRLTTCVLEAADGYDRRIARPYLRPGRHPIEVDFRYEIVRPGSNVWQPQFL